MDLESPTVGTQSAAPQSSGSNVTASNSASNNDVPPPLPSQRKTALDSTNPTAAPKEPGDSPPLPKVQENLLNDGILDQISRRGHRKPIIWAALFVLGTFTGCLTAIVGTLSSGFYQALKPENIAKFAVVELREKVDKASAGAIEKSVTPAKSETTPTSSNKETTPSNAKSADERAPAKENEPIKVEAKIYGEIRDSMVPLVALVSILAVAIVVILGTMLKAAFAPHPNHSSDSKEKETTSPVPLLEAIKGLVESVKAALK